eukprot:jgi/Orpsp1_1/1180056/evm.model.c7180000071985.2
MKELSKLFGNFSTFIEKESGYKGINNIDNNDYDSDDDEFENMFSKQVDINPNIFMKVLQNELGFDIKKSKLYENDNYSSDEDEDEDEDKQEESSNEDSEDDHIINKLEINTNIKEEEEINDENNNLKNKEENNDIENKKDEMLETYYDVMDRELYKTKLSKDFMREENDNKGKKEDVDEIKEIEEKDSDDENIDYKPVQLDLNLVQNLLDSFEAQEGNAGPTTSILKTLGQRLPKRNKDHEIIINSASSSSNI